MRKLSGSTLISAESEAFLNRIPTFPAPNDSNNALPTKKEECDMFDPTPETAQEKHENDPG